MLHKCDHTFQIIFPCNSVKVRIGYNEKALHWNERYPLHYIQK